MAFDNSEPSDEKQKQIEKLQKNLKTYQEKLLQVDRRNRSVQFKKIFHKHNFDLATLEEFNESICNKISEKVLKNRTSSFNFFLDSVVGDDADAIRSKLRHLSNNLKQIEEETGQQTGFVGFPFLQGHANSDFFVRGPLVLFPVSLEQKRQAKGGGWFLNFLDTRPIINGALIAAIKKKAELKIPDNIEDTFEELVDELIEYDKLDIEEFFLKRITEWVNEIVPLDSSKTDFILQKIPSLTRKDIEDLEIQKFHLINYKILGNFPQADNEIYKDYGKLLERASSLDVGTLGDLIDVYNPDDLQESEQTFEEIELDSIPDSRLNTVLDSDSSQDRVILESKRNNLVVVRGPPGTGKSQVITNLISDALTNHKKILVVCQKRAALDVVYQRLGKVGLEKFVVVLDKEHDDRLKMYQQLYDTIEDSGHYNSGTMSLDDASRQINNRVSSLSQLGKALHKPYFGGVTAQKLYSLSKSHYEPKLDLTWVGISVEWNDLDEYIRKIHGIEDLFKKFELTKNPWFGRKDFSSFGLREKSEITQIINSLKSTVENSLLASSRENQEELVNHFDTFLNNPGFLKRNQKSSAKKISQLLGISDVSEDYVKNNFSLIKNGVEFWNKLPDLLNLFHDQYHKEFHSLCKSPSELISKLNSLNDSLSDYDSMQEYDKKLQEFDSTVEKLLFACKDRLDPSQNWSEIIRQEIFALWIDTIERDNPVLKGNPIEEYNRNQKSLAELLEAKKTIVRNQIQSRIASSVTIPDISGRAQTPEKRAWKEFSAELKKKRRTKPVRKLFESYPQNFLKLAPCWLASPESVCKVFPLQRNLFDLVIVDEASQLAVERALPFLYRAKNVVIAGDEKQLQPFDLFQLREDEDDDYDDEITEEKSLLDLAIVHHHPIQLAWHYRSRYQDLINFSNHAFYEGLLQVAPNVRTDPKHPPIRWIPCNGMWDKRQNHAESLAVLDEIIKLWKKFSKTGNYPSIGVITFNDEQRDLIQEQFDKKLDSDIEFQQLYALATEGKKTDDRPFFKNIENVQGDERDIIIFSIGYAKDPDGLFANRFGTLSKQGGQNRLNVAITRARQEMVIVCSIEPNLIKETSKNPGPRRLRQFLEYARASSQLNNEAVAEVLSRINENMPTVDKASLEFDSPFETQVHQALTKHGYVVHTQIGASDYKIDLAVVHPDDPYRYVLAIECDGATFHSSKSAKERDVMRQKFLEDKGWKFERIWSRNWWRNSEEEIQRIISRIKKELNSSSIEPETIEPETKYDQWVKTRSQTKIDTNSNLTANPNKILISEIKSYIKSKKFSSKNTIQTQTSILKNFSDLTKKNPNDSYDDLFEKFVRGKSPSSVSHSRSVIYGFLKYRETLLSKQEFLATNETSKIVSKFSKLFKENSLTQEQFLLLCFLEAKSYDHIMELTTIPRPSIRRVYNLPISDKIRILQNIDILTKEDVGLILSKLPELFSNHIISRDEYEQLRDTLEKTIHTEISPTNENQTLSKDEASKELSLLPQKLANKEITSEEYRKRRSELEDILFD